MKILRIKKSSDFKLARKDGSFASAKGLMLQAVRSDAILEERPDFSRIGFTVSKKVGNSVERNRVKRRLKSLSQKVISEHAAPFYDYVIIGKKAALDRSFEELEKDLKFSLHATKTYRKSDAQR